MLTGAQIRSARAAVGWSAQELADRAGVSMKTVMRLESANGVPPSRSDTLNEIQVALEVRRHRIHRLTHGWTWNPHSELINA